MEALSKRLLPTLDVDFLQGEDFKSAWVVFSLFFLIVIMCCLCRWWTPCCLSRACKQMGANSPHILKILLKIQ